MDSTNKTTSNFCSNCGNKLNDGMLFCDKCGMEIGYTYRKGFVGLYTYAKREKNSIFKKSFDLCKNCENELQNWICNNETSISTRIIKSFPVFKG